ncbi:hypothetical protein AZZ73_002866, partial [Klebsiella pneumoniae]
KLMIIRLIKLGDNILHRLQI